MLIPTMITDPAEAAQVATLAARSDAGSTGAYAHDLYAADLRPQLKALTAPTLEIAPVPTKPASYEGPQAATETIAARAAGYERFYESLFAGATNVHVATIANSRHFVMIDQPQALYDAISPFIASLATQ